MKAVCAVLGALVAAAPVGAASLSKTEHVVGWTLTADPPAPGAGCSMTLGDARGRLAFRLAGDELSLEATSKNWFASGSLSYPVHLTIDGDPPSDIAAEGSAPDTLRLLPNPKLSTAGLVERLKAGKSLAVRKEGNPAIESVTFDVADFGTAYPRLEACAAAAGSRAGAATAKRSESCAKLADGAAAAVGGAREPMVDADRIAVTAAPDLKILVLCGSADEAPSIELRREGPGMPAGFLTAAGKLAGVLTGRPIRIYAALPAACLKRLTVATLRRGGRRTHFPEGTTTFYFGEVKAGMLKLACQYYDARMAEPLISLDLM